jgi:hypothetical protein
VRNLIHHGPRPQWSIAALATIDTEVMLPAELHAIHRPSLGAQPLATLGNDKLNSSAKSSASKP